MNTVSLTLESLICVQQIVSLLFCALLCMNVEGKGINSCDTCVFKCVFGLIHQGTSMMLLGGGVFVDGCQIFSPILPAGTSLSPWQGAYRVWHSVLALGLSPGTLSLSLFGNLKQKLGDKETGASLLFFFSRSSLIVSRNFVVCFFILRGSATKSKVWSWCFYSSSNMTEYLLLILYFSAFICLCALVCLYFSGCQEMTYKHDGKVLCGVWKS